MYVYLKSIHVYIKGDECTFTWKVYMFMYRVMSVRLPGKYLPPGTMV